MRRAAAEGETWRTTSREFGLAGKAIKKAVKRPPPQGRRKQNPARRPEPGPCQDGSVLSQPGPVPLRSIAPRVTATGVCVAFAMGAAAFGQVNTPLASAGPQTQSATYVPTLTFDVASIRECPPGPQRNGFNYPLRSGGLIGTCVWADQLIGWAYGVDYRLQVVGGPAWVKTARSNEVRFEVQATSDSETDDKLAKLSDDQAKLEKQHMLQELLKSRFGLRVHRETRQEPAFALTIAKHGPHLEKGEPPPPRPEHFSGPWPSPIDDQRDPRGMEIVAHGASIGGGGASTWGLAGWLQFYLGKRIIDQTGITGTYNFTLQFHGTLSDMGTDSGSTWPPVETAIKEQLGLQLRDTKAPLQVVVIDHIERPSPN